MDVRKGECSGGGDHRRLSYLRLAARTSGLPQGGRVALPGQTSCADRARPAVHATSRECDFVKLGRAGLMLSPDAGGRSAEGPRRTRPLPLEEALLELAVVLVLVVLNGVFSRSEL